MRYSIVDIKKAERYGLPASIHRTCFTTKMVVNENELLRVSLDIDEAASMLGGEVLTELECFEELKKDK